MLSNLHEKCIIDAAETGVLQYLSELGLKVVIDWNFHRFRKIVQDNYGWVNPTFDPTTRSIHPSSFWIGLQDAKNDFVAFRGNAYFDDQDFESLIHNGGLFWDRDKLPDDFSRQGKMRRLSRLVPAPFTHSGLQWTSPEWEGLYISHYMTLLGRILTLRYLTVTNFTNCILQQIKSRSVPTSAYDYPEHGIDLVLKGYSPHAKKMITLYACHVQREDAVMRLAQRIGQRPSKVLPTSREEVRARAQA